MKQLKSYAIANTVTGEIKAYRPTRQEARDYRKYVGLLNSDWKIVKMVSEGVIR